MPIEVEGTVDGVVDVPIEVEGTVDGVVDVPIEIEGAVDEAATVVCVEEVEAELGEGNSAADVDAVADTGKPPALELAQADMVPELTPQA